MKSKRVLICAIVAVVILATVLLILLPRGGQEVQAGNLLLNGDFSRLDENGLPAEWYTDDYMQTPGYTEYAAKDGIATITNLGLNDARFAQAVSVLPDSLYCFSGEIRAQAEGGLGANLSVEGIYVFSESVYDSQDEWQTVRVYGRTGENQRQVTVFARLGGYSGEATGTASFRNLSLEQVTSVPAEYVAYKWYREENKQVADEDSAAASSAWPWLLAIACGYAAVCFFLRGAVLEDRRDLQKKKTDWLPVGGMLLLALILRLLIAKLIPGYNVDIGCFTYWSDFMAHTGAADFYNTVGFCDYPPGYVLVLGLLGHVGQGLGTGVTPLLVKLPSILCDVAAAAVLYGFARKRISRTAAFSLAALYAFNPLTFAAGAAWGQADSVMALCLMLVVVLAVEGRWSAALPLYMLSVLLKPQALMFGPLGLLALVYELIRKKDKKLYVQTGIGLGLAAAVGLAVVLPFSPKMDNSEDLWIVNLYKSTMGYYDSATVNACNLYFLFDKNWIKVAEDAAWYIRLTALFLLLGGVLYTGLRCRWLRRDRLRLAALIAAAALILAGSLIPMSFSAFGTAVIVLSVLLCAALYAAGGEIRHLPLLGAVLLILLCNLGVMMHERYLFAAVLLLAMACVLERDVRVYALFAAVSVCVFLNVGFVLDRGIRIGGSAGHLNAPAYHILSDSAGLEYAVAALQCLITLFAGITAVQICAEGKTVRFAAMQTAEQKEALSARTPAAAELDCPQTIQPMKALDWAVMLGMTAIYAVAALTNLGSTKSPQTWWRSATAEDQVVLDLGETHAMNMVYLGGIHSREQEFVVRTSSDGEIWSDPYWAQIAEGDCFKWKYVSESHSADGTRNYTSTPELLVGRYVRIEARSIATTIYEVILRDPETQRVFPVRVVSGAGEALVDEQDTFTGEPGWYNSTYFDEIYHARTGYEHYLAMRGDYTYRPYEISHPPLGKVLIAFAISIFGMTPFGWRFAGAMAGVLMLPGMYLLGKMLTKRRITAFAAMFLLAVDCMHFTQTRIATIDSFVVLFILWSFVFMVYYIRMDYWNTKLWKTLIPLGLSGLCMGLAVASKWTGCYAGVGLAVLFFWSLYRRFNQSLYARDEKKVHPAQPRYAAAAREIWSRPVITLLSCLIFFIAVPLLIYYASYIPYFLPYTPSGVTVKRVIQAAVGDYFDTGITGGMLGYHSTPGLGMNHPFYSPWYEWPVIGKPMWYYSTTYRTPGSSQTIAAFGNPLVWWGGLAALLAVALIWLARHVRRDGIHLYAARNDMRPAILLIGFAAQYVPWTLVPRGTYIYHYFPSVPFIILCTALCLDLLYDLFAQPMALPLSREKKITLNAPRLPLIFTLLILAAGLGLFIAFFPYASGVTAGNGWLRAMQWFDGWLYY